MPLGIRNPLADRQLALRTFAWTRRDSLELPDLDLKSLWCSGVFRPTVPGLGEYQLCVGEG